MVGGEFGDFLVEFFSLFLSFSLTTKVYEEIPSFRLYSRDIFASGLKVCRMFTRDYYSRNTVTLNEILLV